MHVIGFRELNWHQTPNGMSLREAVRVEAHPDEGRVITYLRGGTAFAVRPMVVGDFLRPEREMVSTSHWYTDGVWIWPTDLIYYVEEYHTELPADFKARMVSVGWVCPPVSREQVARVYEWWARSQWPEKTEPTATPDSAP